MDISLLNENFKRSKLIENWSSLVWTERYASNGDFELVSSNISEIMSLLPLEGEDGRPTLVALDGSDVPMVVETHKIEKKKNNPPQIVTTGRSFETVMDRRTTVTSVTSGSPRTDVQITSSSISEAVRIVAAFVIEGGVPAVEDKILEINLLNSVSETGASNKYLVEPKELYSWMIETLALGPYGLRSELGPSNTQIAVIIYKGVDKSEEVVFSVELEQFDDAEYLLSMLGQKNVMITATTNGMEFSYVSDTIPSGLNRSVAFQDLASEINVPAGPELTNLTINRGKVALASLLPIALFSGGIAENIGSGYGSIYSLGDIVTLQGEYGLSQKARVAEFIRSQDASGYKAYPTFEAVV